MVDMELQDLIQEYKRQLQASCRDEKEFEERNETGSRSKIKGKRYAHGQKEGFCGHWW